MWCCMEARSVASGARGVPLEVIAESFGVEVSEVKRILGTQDTGRSESMDVEGSSAANGRRPPKQRTTKKSSVGCKRERARHLRH